MAEYTWVDAEVFASAAAPAAWQVLDLTVDTTAVPGPQPTGLSGRNWVFIEAVIDAATNDLFFKPGGDPTDWQPPANTNSRGTTVGYGSNAHSDHVVYLAQTNADGEVEWLGSGATNVTLNLLAFIDATYSDTLIPTAGLAALPAWNDVDASGLVGEEIALILLRLFTTVYVNIDIGTRPYGNTDGSFLDVWAGTAAGTARTLTPSANEDGSILGLTDDAGVFQLGLSALGATVSYYGLSYVVQGNGLEIPAVGDEIVYPDATPPTAGHVDLDCSGAIGKQAAAVLLWVRNLNNIGLGGNAFGFRPKGKAGNWSANAWNARGVSSARGNTNTSMLAIGFTDSDGIVEWNSYPAVGADEVRVSVIAWLGRALFSISSITQTSLNTVEIVFSETPRHIDPSDPRDAMYRDAYTVTGPIAPAPQRLIQAVEWGGGATVSLVFDGPLVPGEAYAFSVAGLETESGAILNPSPSTGALVAYGGDVEPVPLEQQPSDRYDIRNPQAQRDAPAGAPLGTYVLTDQGGIDRETTRAYLRKRIFRRLATPPGSMLHLPEYGLLPELKRLYRPADLRRLAIEIESQLSAEPDVVSVRVSVSESAPGIVIATIQVRDVFGTFEVKAPVGEAP